MRSSPKLEIVVGNKNGCLTRTCSCAREGVEGFECSPSNFQFLFRNSLPELQNYASTPTSPGEAGVAWKSQISITFSDTAFTPGHGVTLAPRKRRHGGRRFGPREAARAATAVYGFADERFDGEVRVPRPPPFSSDPDPRAALKRTLPREFRSNLFHASGGADQNATASPDHPAIVMDASRKTPKAVGWTLARSRWRGSSEEDLLRDKVTLSFLADKEHPRRRPRSGCRERGRARHAQHGVCYLVFATRPETRWGRALTCKLRLEKLVS